MKVTILMSTYNGENFLAEQIESIQQQTYTDWTLLIRDDGSKDKTSQIAHEYMDKYPDIIKVIDKENGGHGDAVNAGLANASGKYFKVVDSDDWVDEEALHKILMLMRHLEEDNEQIDMLIFQLCL